MEKLEYPTCDVRHLGECKANTKACFLFCKSGHKKADFPHRKRHDLNNALGFGQSSKGGSGKNRDTSRPLLGRSQITLIGTLHVFGFHAFSLFDF